MSSKELCEFRDIERSGCFNKRYTYIRLVSAIEVKRKKDQTSHDNQTRIHPGKLVRAKWNNQIKNLQSSTRLFLLSTMISTPEQAVIGGAWLGLLECCDAAVKCPTLLCNLVYRQPR
jgi:hypothetical protein